jgi:transcription initiation factor TFIIIB Brf1 subunit/transcription initiation factor TFIIB
MAKQDPKDERIAELEAKLKASNEATARAEEKAALQAQTEAQLKRQDTKIAEMVESNERLKTLLQQLRAESTENELPRVSELGEAAAQLTVSCVLTSATTGRRIEAVAGDVICEKSQLEKLAVKLGTDHKIHAVSKEELAVARRAGRAR